MSTGQIEAEDASWGESFALSRWLRGRPPVQELSFQRVLALSALGKRSPSSTTGQARDVVAVSPVNLALPGSQVRSGPSCADEELTVLRSLGAVGAGVEVLPALKRELQAAFERGGFNLLHMACHGTFGGVESADASAMMMEDGEFTAAELSPRLEGAMRGKVRPSSSSTPATAGEPAFPSLVLVRGARGLWHWAVADSSELSGL